MLDFRYRVIDPEKASSLLKRQTESYLLNQSTGERATRDQVLQFFTNSPEFQTRVQEVIDAGCLP